MIDRLDEPENWLDELENEDFSEDDEQLDEPSFRAEELKIHCNDAIRLGIAKINSEVRPQT
jgi:hypothetical protein